MDVAIGHGGNGDGGLDQVRRRLMAGFPDATPDLVSSVLADSYRVVAAAADGVPTAQRVEELARLRLEVRTGHPYAANGDAGSSESSRT
jgi:hypothetical protein